MVDFFQLPFHGEQGSKDGQDFAVSAFFEIAADMLFHITNDSGTCLIDFPAVAGQVAGQHAEQRCFTGAVYTDKANVVAFLNFKRCTAENHVGAKGFLKVAGAE